jgi:hypothetical protein
MQADETTAGQLEPWRYQMLRVIEQVEKEAQAWLESTHRGEDELCELQAGLFGRRVSHGLTENENRDYPVGEGLCGEILCRLARLAETLGKGRTGADEHKANLVRVRLELVGKLDPTSVTAKHEAEMLVKLQAEGRGMFPPRFYR